MPMPKYKPTKWKLSHCMECNKLVERRYWCDRNNHTLIEKDNVPFKIPDMKVDYFGYKGWLIVESEKMKQSFCIAPSEVQTVIKGCGVQPGGSIPDQWWMWTKKGSSLSLKWLEDDSNE